MDRKQLKETTTEIVGYRFIEGYVDVGTELEKSHHWDGDEPTDVVLDGTCAFERLSDCQRYAQWSNGYIVGLSGSDYHSGDLPGERIIRDAVVVSIRRWR